MLKVVKSILVLSSVFWLSACGEEGQKESASVDSSSETSNVATAALTVSYSFEEDGQPIDKLEKEIEAEEGQTVLEVLQENYDVADEDGMVTSIEGIEQNDDEGKWWMYSVNDEEPTVGASEYILKDGDEVKWSLNAF